MLILFFWSIKMEEVKTKDKGEIEQDSNRWIVASHLMLFAVCLISLAHSYCMNKQIAQSLETIMNQKNEMLVEMKKLKAINTKQNEVIRSQSDKLKINETQIGAMQRRMNNQAEQLNKLDKVAEETKALEEATPVQEPPAVVEQQEEQNKNVVEMPVLESYQIVLPKSQKVFQK